jgi:predicted phage terminase large subunit-like protein
MDLWAREHYKSTIITFAKSVQDILSSHGENPLIEWNGREVTIGIFSFNRPSAKGFLRQIKREFESNEELKLLFPDILYADPQREAVKWSEDEGLIVKRSSNPKEATVEAHGLVDGQPTGKHFFIRVYDDIVTLESARSSEMVKKTTQSWEISLNLGADGGHERYVGTFYADGDSYHDIIERDAAKLRKRPGSHDGTASGKPVFWSQETFDKKRKSMGPHTFSTQILLDPIPDDNAYFSTADFQWYDEAPKHLTIYGASDYAVTEGGGDWTEHGIAGVDPNDDLYILDWWSGQTKADEWIESQLDLVKQHQPVMWGNESGPIRRAIEPFLAKRIKERRDYVRLEWMPSVADKPTRCRSFQARAASKKVFLKRGAPWAEDLLRQLLRFPIGKVDDKVDVCGLFGRMLDKMYSGSVPTFDTETKKDPYGFDDEDVDNWKTS